MTVTARPPAPRRRAGMSLARGSVGRMKIDLTLHHKIEHDDEEAVAVIEAIVQEEFARVVARIGDRIEEQGMTDLRIEAHGGDDLDPRGDA